MNLEHYRNFVTVVDTGTISGAAERLLIAQPALTKQIQQLEEKYGAQLVIRRPRKIELTDAGRILYDKIKSIIYLEDAAQKEINSCIIGNRGNLSFGRTPAQPDPLIDQLLLDFHAQYPEITFRIIENNSNHLVELMQSGMIEVGLIRSQYYIPAELRPILSVRESLMVYFHKEHPVLRPEMGSIPVEALKSLPISVSVGLQNQFSLACETAGFQPNIREVSSSRALCMMWARDRETVAITVSPRPLDLGDYCIRRLETRQMDTIRAFTVKRDRKLSAVAETFLQFCEHYQGLQDWEVHEEES